MIRWLNAHLGEAALISLDHDLEPERAGEDPGTGRDVVAFLAGRSAVCAVIVHTSIGTAASGMCFALEGAGWSSIRVVPVDELEWVKGDWIREVLRLCPAVRR